MYGTWLVTFAGMIETYYCHFCRARLCSHSFFNFLEATIRRFATPGLFALSVLGLVFPLHEPFPITVQSSSACSLTVPDKDLLLGVVHDPLDRYPCLIRTTSRLTVLALSPQRLLPTSQHPFPSHARCFCSQSAGLRGP